MLDRPEVPGAANGSEGDIRVGSAAQGQRRHTQRSGRDCRDTFLGLAKTCAKQGVAFRDYLGSRLSGPCRGPRSFHLCRSWSALRRAAGLTLAAAGVLPILL